MENLCQTLTIRPSKSEFFDLALKTLFSSTEKVISAPGGIPDN
jgi:hypothetical protein